MNLAFWKSKPKKQTVQLRQIDGTYGPKLEAVAVNPAMIRQPPLVKQVQDEQTAFTATAATMDGILSFVDKLNGMVNAKVDERLGEFDDDSGMPGGEWVPVIQQLIPFIGPYIGPYIPGIMEKLGIQPAQGTPSIAQQPSDVPAASTSEPAAGLGGLGWIKAAAHTSPKVIKPLIGRIDAGLAERGVDPAEFKQAIANLAKAYKVEA